MYGYEFIISKTKMWNILHSIKLDVNITLCGQKNFKMCPKFLNTDDERSALIKEHDKVKALSTVNYALYHGYETFNS